MVESCTQQLAAYNKVTSEDIRNSLLQKILLGRVSKADDIANLVSFLAGNESDYITGQSIIIDGGYSLS